MRGNLLMRVIDWLRVGYPEGVPREDYVALFGILHRDLTATEIEHVVRTLRSDPTYPSTTSSVPDDQVRVVIEQLIHERASHHDVARVQARLAQTLPVHQVDERHGDGVGGVLDGADVPSDVHERFPADPANPPETGEPGAAAS